jgi:hypothetical protein
VELISSVEISGNAVAVRAAEEFAGAYLREDLWVSYDVGGGDLAIDEGLAVVPFLANVAPVVWLAGIDATVPLADGTFMSALDDVRAVFADMYPGLAWEGSIRADRVGDPEGSGEQLALLFSGGVDSVFSSLSLEGSQLLATIRGSDIALENDHGWEAVRAGAAKFGASRGHRNAFIETNFRRLLDVPVIERRWPQVGEWWPHVQHGIGLLGLLAPLVPAGRVVIAASHSPEFGIRAWGSSPRLDTALRWGGTTVDHHGFETSRQAKVERIVADGGPPPELRVCYSNPYGDGRNCGRCEKCLRTFTALVAAGADPGDYGMPMSLEVGMRRVRRRFRTYRVFFNATKPRLWGDVQQSISRTRGGDDAGIDRMRVDGDRAEFLEWVSRFDFAGYERRWRVFLKARARMLRTMRRVPVTERIARRMIAAGHRLRGTLAAGRR